MAKKIIVSRKQRANINLVLKPFYVTSRCFDSGIRSSVNFYSKYFARRRHPIRHFLPKYSICLDTFRLTILFNAYKKKFGYAKKRRPTTWIFCGNVLLTKYGHKKQQKKLKLKREKRRKRRQRQTSHNQFKKSAIAKASNELRENNNNNVRIIVSESPASASKSVEQSIDENDHNHMENDASIEILPDHDGMHSVQIEMPEENRSDANVNMKEDEFSAEPIDNIWNLDIQEVAALITENGGIKPNNTFFLYQVNCREGNFALL